MRDLGRHIVGLLGHAPKTQEAVAAALHVEAHPTAAGKTVWHWLSGAYAFAWHPLSQKVYLMLPTGQKAPDGSEVREGYCIAFNIITHGDAKNAALIFNRAADLLNGRRNAQLTEGKEALKTHG